VEELGERHVVLTGGEPMLFSELVPLCEQLQRRRMHITVETAGTLYLPLQCDLMSISPKLSNSTPREASRRWQQRHERTRWAPDVVRRLMAEHSYQLKFVCQSEADALEVIDYLDDFPELERDRVMLMPEGTDQPQLQQVSDWLEATCVKYQLRFCPRRQIEWFGMQRGT
jgi:7-carboxy-7-deazaguanine synthase